MKAEIKPRYLSPSNTAKILGVSRSHIYDLVKSNEIPHDLVGKKIIIPVSYLEERYGVAI